ncbi:hypothetical protein FIV42_10505 [Persicimonas caeni]|uniref:Uncharacterized protein n=1 Tax=Persicimonas caeni TaxID=2292766 RepID=A0A4Y6PS59_PERCE|nr:hypothetical protein [Persicimonas caeni]QDG51151.1 hypothetical protein FIV42_10505 [Persicimonas caeni]QED32372.1 hypothetical protein FRD00_10500 [Persicimonas caeni]
MSKKKTLGNIGKALALGAAISAVPGSAFAEEPIMCEVDEESTIDAAGITLEVTEQGTYKILIDPAMVEELEGTTGITPTAFDIVVDDMVSAAIVVRN